MIIYNTPDLPNVIGKVKNVLKDINIKLPSNIDVINPVIVLSGFNPNDVMGFNYCFIPELNRYYFVNNVVVVGAIAKLYLAVDVLETYKDDILSGVYDFKRPIKDGDYQEIYSLNESDLIDVVNFTSDKEVFNSQSLVLFTLGGGA